MTHTNSLFLYFLILLISLISFINPAKAGNENYSLGARSAGIANASVCLTDIWAVHHNQAAMADLKDIEAAIFYENKFLVKELGLKAVAFVLPTKGGVFGFSLSQFGYQLYKESKVGLAYSKKFGDILSAGVQMDYLNTYIAEGYGSKGDFAAEAGLRAKLTKGLYIGFHAYNFNRAKLADYNNEHIPVIFRLGLQYSFSDKVFLAAETEKDIDFKPVFKTGIEYHAVKQVYFRIGIATNPLMNTFGFGMDFNRIRVDLAASMDPVLGVSSQVAVIGHFK